MLPSRLTGDGSEPQPVTNPSYSSPSRSASNEGSPSSTLLGDLLVRLREAAPNLRVDAAGNLAGFGTLAHWPEGLIEELGLHRNAIREALLAERRASAESPPERDEGAATKPKGGAQ